MFLSLSCCQASSGRFPVKVVPSSEKVTFATTGNFENDRIASIATSNSSTSLNVSSMNRSTPRSSSAPACSRKIAKISSGAISRTCRTAPTGPIDPAIKTSCLAASRASRAIFTPRWFSSATRSPIPNWLKLMSICAKCICFYDLRAGLDIRLVHSKNRVRVRGIQLFHRPSAGQRSRTAASPWLRRRRGCPSVAVRSDLQYASVGVSGNLVGSKYDTTRAKSTSGTAFARALRKTATALWAGSPS